MVVDFARAGFRALSDMAWWEASAGVIPGEESRVVRGLQGEPPLHASVEVERRADGGEGAGRRVGLFARLRIDELGLFFLVNSLP